MQLIAKYTVFMLAAALLVSEVVQGSWPVVSVPKNLPTKVKSLWEISDNASMGYNGNRHGTYAAGVNCVNTYKNELLPWWMLDMLQTYIVKGVDFYLRTEDNYHWSRSQFITIGISSQQLVWNNFNAGLFETCFFNPHPVVVGVNPLNFTCYRALSGRYLAVYRDLKNSGFVSTDMMLNFCEIDVFAYERSSRIAVPMVQQSAPPTSTSVASQVASLNVRSDRECAFLCSESQECLHIMVSYDPSTGVTQCYLLRSFSLPDGLIGVGAAKFYSFDLK